MATCSALSSSPAIVVTGSIQNSDPHRTATLMVWFRKAGSVRSARRFRETEDNARRSRIGSCRKMSNKSSAGKALKGSLKGEVGNRMNVGVGKTVGGEGQLKANKLM